MRRQLCFGERGVATIASSDVRPQRATTVSASTGPAPGATWRSPRAAAPRPPGAWRPATPSRCGGWARSCRGSRWRPAPGARGRARAHGGPPDAGHQQEQAGPGPGRQYQHERRHQQRVCELRRRNHGSIEMSAGQDLISSPLPVPHGPMAPWTYGPMDPWTFRKGARPIRLGGVPSSGQGRAGHAGSAARAGRAVPARLVTPQCASWFDRR